VIFFTKFGMARECQIRTLMPNFTIMALEMGAEVSHQNHQNMEFLP